jgi:DNA-binding NarL/FixJ family response regulator
MDQALALPAAGPGPVSGLWLWLQIAIALEDRDQVAATAQRLAPLDPSDERSRVRVAAAAVWARIMAGTADEAEVVEVSARLTAAGDSWEASRLLGQAALDEHDPRAARRLLELARVSSNEPVDADGDDALVGLGLSEREAEVALMVVDGRTHKEIGAQLFISPKTVEHHVAKIRQKLGATSRAELVATIREAVAQA